MKRITEQILAGKWQYNGDTIKVAKSGDVLDGQHRLWACIEADRSIKTVVVYGIEKEAFATIDTLRKTRSGADILALAGLERHRSLAAGALRWLLLYQRKQIPEHMSPSNKIENSDIEAAYAAHPGIVRAVERCRGLSQLCNRPMIICFYYITANRDADLAERMIATLEDPSQIPMTDPFMLLRLHFTEKRMRKRSRTIDDIALVIKALNAGKKGLKIKTLKWQGQGQKPEPFPDLEI